MSGKEAVNRVNLTIVIKVTNFVMMMVMVMMMMMMMMIIIIIIIIIISSNGSRTEWSPIRSVII